MSADSLVDDFYVDAGDTVELSGHCLTPDSIIPAVTEISVPVNNETTKSSSKKRKRQQQPESSQGKRITGAKSLQDAPPIPPVAKPLVLSAAAEIQQHIWNEYSRDAKKKWTDIDRLDAEKSFLLPLETIKVPGDSYQFTEDDFSGFLTKVFDLSKLKKTPKARGKPRIVIVCSSAVRCTELIR